MSYVKYLLGKTGLFPKCEPQIYDVLKAAFQAYEIRKTQTARGHKYFCVIPGTYRLDDINKMVQLFRANGVFLVPKKPKKTNNCKTIVFWVRDRGQPFMQDTFRVNQNANNFQQVMHRYNNRKSPMLKKLFVKFENEK